VGKALVVTTLLLLAGFAPLLASALGTAHHMGLLISLTLVVAGITDLVLLPVLVLCWGARR
jgi:predicted RND superfamily exporter protein